MKGAPFQIVLMATNTSAPLIKARCSLDTWSLEKLRYMQPWSVRMWILGSDYVANDLNLWPLEIFIIALALAHSHPRCRLRATYGRRGREMGWFSR